MSVINVTEKDFQREVLESDVPVLVDFCAPWCGPCRMLGPILDEVAQERSDIKVCKVNVDEETSLASRYQVVSIPTVLAVKDGQVLSRSVGVRPKRELLSMI